MEERGGFLRGWGCPAKVLEPRCEEEGVHMGEKSSMGYQSPRLRGSSREKGQ